MPRNILQNLEKTTLNFNEFIPIRDGNYERVITTGNLVANLLRRDNNLSDLNDVAVARVNLGLDASGMHPDNFFVQSTEVGTGANQIVRLDGQARLPALDASQLINLPNNGGGITTETDPLSLHIANNLSDLNDVVAARTNLGLGSAALRPDTYFARPEDIPPAGITAETDPLSLHIANNLSDLADPSVARGNLGIGASGTHADAFFVQSIEVGTAANQIPRLDGQGRLPAIDGSQLTNLPAGGGGGITEETDPLSLHKANNLSDITNAVTARNNLGLGILSINGNDVTFNNGAANWTRIDRLQARVVAEGSQDLGAVAAPTFNLGLVNCFRWTKSGGGSVTISYPNNLGSVDQFVSFTVVVTNGGSTGSTTWPTSIKWAGGTIPSLTAAGIDILTFITYDGGTTWHGMLASKDSK